jgi:hypothetical protein
MLIKVGVAEYIIFERKLSVDTMKKICLLLLACCIVYANFGQVRKTTTYPVRTAKKPSTSSKSRGSSTYSPAITPVTTAPEKNVVYQYIDTTFPNSDNQFPVTGFAGIGTKKPQAPLEIRKNAGDTRRKNILLQLSNNWSPNGQNEPSIMFSNGDEDKLNNSYWTVGARVSGDNTLNTPQTFKVCFKRPGVDVEQEFFSINSYEGRVKIGNVNDLVDGYKLYVEQGILTEKVKVAVANSEDWYDHVFEPSYKKMELKDVESFIKKYKHLPDIPTTEQVMKDGLDLGKMNGLLLKKVEELTLYMIDLKKELDDTKKEVATLKAAKKK